MFAFICGSQTTNHHNDDDDGYMNVKRVGLGGLAGGRRGKERILRGEKDQSMLHMYTYIHMCVYIYI
jgi:hypothetical protein